MSNSKFSKLDLPNIPKLPTQPQPLSNRDRTIVQDGIRILPENMKNDITKIYDERFRKLNEWAQGGVEKEEKDKLLKDINISYQKTMDKTQIAINILLKLFKRRELSNISLSGLEDIYIYDNPDPEDLLQKIQKEGPE